MTRWRIVLEYDGTAFFGWNVQPRQRTVQGVVEEALAQLLGEEVRVDVSGRTDAGVHAREQVAAFTTHVDRTARSVRHGLNAHLPDDVACLDAVAVPLDFDPRRQARRKHYRYVFLDRGVRSPLRRDRAWLLRHPLDVEAMGEGARHLLGQHDFSSFRATGCGAEHPVRTLQDATVRRVQDEVWLDVFGHGFLRHMVRIVAGTLVEVGHGVREPAWVAEVLAARDRSAAGRTAPACGLTLMRVIYEPETTEGADLQADPLE